MFFITDSLKLLRDSAICLQVFAHRTKERYNLSEIQRRFTLTLNYTNRWAVAQSPMMRTTVTLDRLIRIGYQSFSNTYLSVSPFLANRLIPNGM